MLTLIRKECENHILRGRKDKKQSALLQSLVNAKTSNPNMSLDELYYMAHGYKLAQR